VATRYRFLYPLTAGTTGAGANTFYGAGGAARPQLQALELANAGSGYGAGGGVLELQLQVPQNVAGGAGSPGIVIITEFIN